MADATDITLIRQYAEKFSKSLINIAVTNNEVFRKFNVIPGVKDKYTQHTLNFEKMLRPYAGRDWDPKADKMKIKPRTGRVEVGEVMLEEEPMKFRKTYFGEIMKKGVNPKDFPFQQALLEGIANQAATDFNDDTAFFGVHNSEGTAPVDVNDGFFTHMNEAITDGELSVEENNLINTGDINATNAVDVLKGFYRECVGKNPSLRNKKIKLRISHEILQHYEDHYQAKNGVLPYNKQFEQTFVEGSAKNCILEPLTSMGNSKRIILTPDFNMSILVDLLSDQEKVEITKGINPKVIGFYLACAYGTQIWTFQNVFFTNEQNPGGA